MVLLAISVIQMSRFAYADCAPSCEGKIVCPFPFSSDMDPSPCCSHRETADVHFRDLEIWGSHSGGDEDSSLAEYDAACTGMLVLYFGSGFLPPPQVSLSPNDGGKHLLRKVDAYILLYMASYPGITESSNAFPPLLLLFSTFLLTSHLRKQVKQFPDSQILWEIRRNSK